MTVGWAANDDELTVGHRLGSGHNARTSAKRGLDAIDVRLMSFSFCVLVDKGRDLR
jgi:hypothetical protein